jgi:hypothetical protein
MLRRQALSGASDRHPLSAARNRPSHAHPDTTHPTTTTPNSPTHPTTPTSHPNHTDTTATIVTTPSHPRPTKSDRHTSRFRKRNRGGPRPGVTPGVTRCALKIDGCAVRAVERSPRFGYRRWPAPDSAQLDRADPGSRHVVGIELASPRAVIHGLEASRRQLESVLRTAARTACASTGVIPGVIPGVISGVIRQDAVRPP